MKTAKIRWHIWHLGVSKAITLRRRVTCNLQQSVAVKFPLFMGSKRAYMLAKSGKKIEIRCENR
jgi:hypothetical protein